MSQILGALSGGDSIEDVLEDYPSITSEDISAVFDFAGSLARFEDTPYNLSAMRLVGCMQDCGMDWSGSSGRLMT